MCISLTPIEVTGTFISANKIVDNGQKKVVVSYSIMTSEPGQTPQARPLNLIYRPRPDSNYDIDTVYAWFLPIKDYRYEDIKILDLTSVDKKNINYMIDAMASEKDSVSRSMRTMSANSKSLSDVVTLQDGSQVVRVSAPRFILNEIDNVAPEFRDKLAQTAKQVVDNSTDIINDTCLVYLFKGKTNRARNYLAYEVPFNGGIFWLPTVENDHKTLQFEREVHRDTSIIWGSDVHKEGSSHSIHTLQSTNRITPQYLYGMFDFESTYPNAKFENGFVGIDFDNNDPDNYRYNRDGEALHQFPIFHEPNVLNY